MGCDGAPPPWHFAESVGARGVGGVHGVEFIFGDVFTLNREKKKNNNGEAGSGLNPDFVVACDP